MKLEVCLSKDAHEKIYKSWPEDIRQIVEDGLDELASLDPALAKKAPTPPYPLNLGHVHTFRFKHEDNYQYVQVFYVFSDNLDRILATDVTALPGFWKKAVRPAVVEDGEVIEIPQRG